jgi:hypothetical protein
MMNLASLIDNACYTSAPETFFCQSVLDLGKATAKWRFPALRASQIMLVDTHHQGIAVRKFHTSV